MSEHAHKKSSESEKHAGEDAGIASKSSGGGSAAEWVTLAISIAILVAIAALITWLHVQGRNKPPVIIVESNTGEIRQEGELYYLPVEVSNEGDLTVEDVLVQAELDTGSGTPFTADFTVTFLAGGEHANGTFIFAEDPTQGELTVQAISYKDP